MNFESKFVRREVYCEKHGKVIAEAMYLPGLGQTEADALESATQCPICQEEAFRLEEERESNKLKRERVLKVRQYVMSGLDEKLQNMRFANFKVDEMSKEAVEAFHQLVDGEITSLVVCGSTGVGKTHLAVAALFEMAVKTYDDGRDYIYITQSEMMRKIRSSMSSKRTNEEATFEQFAYADLLIIDEFGRVKNSDQVSDTFFDVINKRTANGLSTIILSNYSQEQMKTNVDVALRSRLMENGKFVVLNGKDRRRV